MASLEGSQKIKLPVINSGGGGGTLYGSLTLAPAWTEGMKNFDEGRGKSLQLREQSFSLQRLVKGLP